MSHSSEKRWPDISDRVSDLCARMVESLLNAESSYQDLLELYAFTGNTAQLLADQLFYEDWVGRADTEANADEVAKAQDLIDAMTSLHELYQAADNVVVAQEDRLTSLRRFT